MKTPAAPSLRVRLACMVYEAMLLFGVLFVAGWLFSTLLQQRNALYLREALQSWLLLVLALYFAWFWSHGGQTLAMKTWRVRVERADGGKLGFARALLRHALAWLCLIPGLALAWLTGAHGWLLLLYPALNLAVWLLLARIDPQRQFPHDRLAHTRLVRTPLLLGKRGQGVSL